MSEKDFVIETREVDMLSDSIFDNCHGLLKDIAWYMTCDRHNLERYGEELFYDDETYVDTLRAMIPLRDVQLALDAGCDPEPLDDEAIAYHERRIVQDILDLLPGYEKKWQENAKANGWV